MRSLAIGLCGVLVTYVAGAGEGTTYSVAISGAGIDKCAVWLSDRSATSDSSLAANKVRIAWLTGFLSGVNLFGERSGHLKGGVDDPNGTLGWIDNYCRANLGDQLWQAAGAFVLDLRNHPRE